MLKSWIETRHSKMKRIGSMLNKTSAEVWLLKRHTRGVVILNKSPVSAMALFAWMQWPSQENKNMPKAQFSKPIFDAHCCYRMLQESISTAPTRQRNCGCLQTVHTSFTSEVPWGPVESRCACACACEMDKFDPLVLSTPWQCSM